MKSIDEIVIKGITIGHLSDLINNARSAVQIARNKAQAAYDEKYCDAKKGLGSAVVLLDQSLSALDVALKQDDIEKLLKALTTAHDSTQHAYGSAWAEDCDVLIDEQGLFGEAADSAECALECIRDAENQICNAHAEWFRVNQKSRHCENKTSDNSYSAICPDCGVICETSETDSCCRNCGYDDQLLYYSTLLPDAFEGNEEFDDGPEFEMYSESTVMLRPSEELYEFTLKEKSAEIIKYKGEEKDVFVPSKIHDLPVVRIGPMAFSDFTTISQIVIPSSVGSIGKKAFFGCANLATVIIPSSVVTIDDDVFGRCTKLKSITIPCNVQSIGQGSFRDCSSLCGIYFRGKPPTIGQDLFRGADNVVVHYESDFKGWEGTFGGRPTSGKKRVYRDSEAATNGDAIAQNRLGLAFALIENNYEEAAIWRRKAAEQGVSSAQYELGWYYENGVGVAQNSAEAVKWFRRSAMQGSNAAQYHLGMAYARGSGVLLNNLKAYMWLLLAETTESDARRELALLKKLLPCELRQSARSWAREWKPVRK